MVQKEKKYITWEGLNQHAKNVGKKIKEYDAGVIGGYNGSFPLTTATKGNIYLLPATKKYYVCIENYNGSQLTAPSANFEELSVYTNRSKLDNLCIDGYKWISEYDEDGVLDLYFAIHKFKRIAICFGQARVKSNYIYKTVLPEEFRPAGTVELTGQTYGNTNIHTSTIRIFRDGTIKTTYPYSTTLISFVAMYTTQ